ncbi:MAG: hypothetical protein KGL17_03570 [Betaproteobacteria bacterium]|nr:hypothetical protein [Betaproteobacteria bacterium]
MAKSAYIDRLYIFARRNFQSQRVGSTIRLWNMKRAHLKRNEDMKKMMIVLFAALACNFAHADGWRGGERWGGGWRGGEWGGDGDGAGWAIGSALVGGILGGMMAQQAPVYAAPAPAMVVPPAYVPAPQPVYAYPPQPVYVQPAYPAPYYYGRREWDDD